MRITLLGTGDTTGTPTVGCECATCTKARERGVERSRFSVHITNEATGEALLIDASPDFRSQFLTHDVAIPDAALITHVHFDHLDGLGNVYRLARDLPVLASDRVDDTTGESVAETVARKYGYLDTVSVTPVTPYETVRQCGLDIELLPVTHPPMDSYGLRVADPNTGGVLGITGDTNFDIPDRTRDRLAGVDLLLADAIVPAAYCRDHPAGGSHHDENDVPRTFGRKHMTRAGALALATDLDPDTVRLVHVSHFYPVAEAFEDPLAVDGETYVC